MSHERASALAFGEEIRPALRAAVHDAGRLIQSGSGEVVARTEKSANDFVTTVDRDSGLLLTSRVRALRPRDHIVCEDLDEGADGSQAGVVWFIDPLDGTANYLHRYPFYTVSIAAYEPERERFLLSMVYWPPFDQLFEAYGDELSTLNGRAIHVSTAGEINRCLILTGMSHRVSADDPVLGVFCRVSVRSAGTRRSGCASLDLCCVAAGFAEAYYHFSLKAWDVAAGAHLVTNAGGKVTNVASQRFALDGRSILASNGVCHHALQAELVQSETCREDPRSITG